MVYIIDKLIYLVAYSSILIGTWFLIYPIYGLFFKKRRFSKRFRDFPKDINQDKKAYKLIKHLEILLGITTNNNSTYSILTFLVISVVLFVISFLFILKTEATIYLTFLISMFFAMIPYLLLRIKLHDIRISSSYEAEILINELLNQYKINYLNMIEAIDQTIHNLPKEIYSKKALLRLSLKVKQYRNSRELEQIIDEFNFSIDTTWSALLANNLFLSIEFGDDVSESLADIIEDLKDLKNITEKNKQYNNESFLMIKYVTPGTYLFSVLAMFYLFGFSVEKYIEFQFLNPLGLKFFLLTISLIIINYLIYFFIKKPKNDF